MRTNGYIYIYIYIYILGTYIFNTRDLERWKRGT